SRCPRFALGAGLLAAGCLGLPAAAQSPIDLPDEVVIGTEMETTTGPVKGYTATRSATATKTDTATTETPRSLSVVTAQRMEDQGAVGTAMDPPPPPFTGRPATRAATTPKTETAMTEAPRSLSVVPAQRVEDQGVQTVQAALRYVSGVRSEAYGLDARVDSALVRGSSPTTFLDGLQQSFGYYTNTRSDPFTLERIEVLKGPASMLYAQNPVA